MDTFQQRRLVFVLVLSFALMVSTYFEDGYDTQGTKSFVEVMISAAKHVRDAMSSVPNKNQYKNRSNNSFRQKRKKQMTDEEFIFQETTDGSFHHPPSDTYDAPARPKISRPPGAPLDLYSCLPRFICEVHAEPPGSRLTELENDIIGLFRNYMALEGPNSPVYKFQFAAHMGQLLMGLEPSPCHQLYSSCPLSKIQLLNSISRVKESRRMVF